MAYDVVAYWQVDLADPYHGNVGDLGFFAYAPPIALVLAPFTHLPWIAFVSLWYALLIGALVWMGRRETLVLLAFPLIAVDLYHGNIHLLIAAAIVIGMRHPAAWSFVLLTKVTPGVGLLWFAVRREWRQLAVALGATAAIVAVTFVILPTQWLGWFNMLVDSAGTPPPWPALPIPLWLRLPIAALIVIWGARRDARWTVPVAAAISVPALWPGALRDPRRVLGSAPRRRAPRARLPCAGCRTAQPRRARPREPRARLGLASRSSCRRTTSRRASGPRSTSCSPTCPAERRRATAAARRATWARSRSSSSTTAATTTPRQSLKRGQKPRRRERPTLRLLRERHTGKGAAVAAGMLAGEGDYIIFADADLATPADQLPLLTEALAEPRHRARQPRPTGRQRPPEQPAGAPTAAGQALPRPRRVLGDRPGAGHAVRLQGFPARGGTRSVQAPEDRQHRLRRRDHPSRPRARLHDRDRAGAVVGQARLAHARPAAASHCACCSTWSASR